LEKRLSIIPQIAVGRNSTVAPSRAATQGKPVPVVIADREALYAVGLGDLIQNVSPRIYSVMAGVKMRSLPRLIQRHDASLLILDDELVLFPDHSIRDILRKRPGLKIMVIYSQPLKTKASSYYRSGVRAMVNRNVTEEDLQAIVTSVLRGNEYLAEQVKEWLVQSLHLSKREFLILGGLVAGKRNKEIAFDIGASEQVVKNIFKRLYGRFSVKNKAELAATILRNHRNGERSANIADTEPIRQAF
jgi:two-component system, NarL family, nitrate/nitrite response regulator NarL